MENIPTHEHNNSTEFISHSISMFRMNNTSFRTLCEIELRIIDWLEGRKVCQFNSFSTPIILIYLIEAKQTEFHFESRAENINFVFKDGIQRILGEKIHKPHEY